MQVLRAKRSGGMRRGPSPIPQAFWLSMPLGIGRIGGLWGCKLYSRLATPMTCQVSGGADA